MHQQIAFSSAHSRHCDVLFSFLREQWWQIILRFSCSQTAAKSCSQCTKRSLFSIFIVLCNNICRCSSNRECLLVVFFFFLSVCNCDWKWPDDLTSCPPGSGVHPGGWNWPLPCLHAPLALRHESEEVCALHIRGLCRQPQQFRLRGVLHGRVQAPE